MKYWLMKSEPNAYSIDDLERERFAEWDGVRNYQARNFMRDEMQVGDLALFYHSNAKPSGVVGICRINKTGIPDHTAWDPNSQYYDPKSSPDNPRWIMVEVEFMEKFPACLPLSYLRTLKELERMKLFEPRLRLSIIPVSEPHFRFIQNHKGGT